MDFTAPPPPPKNSEKPILYRFVFQTVQFLYFYMVVGGHFRYWLIHVLPTKDHLSCLLCPSLMRNEPTHPMVTEMYEMSQL